ncbi:cupin domain-containing protein [Variibacter gotjawalensis]|nr:cupin domain-containing protein [Variibacter gotjawalensis]NIK45984.1 quercetin dioxygenase-like cupin family protein [Variibacter gotjawalensis]
MENHKVRVLEATLKPKDKVGTHEQGEHMFYVLTDGTLVIEAAGRTGYEMAFKAGESFWLPAQTRALQNDGDKPIKALIVEVKGGGSRATPVPTAGGKTSKSRSGRVVFQQRKRR